MKRFIGGALALTMMMGCTQEKPFKEVPKNVSGLVQADKTVIDTSSDYLFVASTVESDRKATSSRPHWMADARRVRFVFTEKDLKVMELEKDERYAANPVNKRAVLTIPIEHIDYKCAEDDFGKCTHKEEESKDIKWDKKRYFILKGEDLALQQLSFLPGEIEKFFGSSCTKEVRSEFVKAEITGDSVNLILEKTFQDSCPNALEFDDAADLSYSVRYQYSFLKLDKMVTPGYQALRYTRSDEGTFGFFPTVQYKLDVDNNDVVDSEKYFFDRWNPKRKEIVYYMSEGFAKPEHKAVRQATIESVEAINEGFRKAGVDLHVTLKDPVPGMSSGDIRHNMIVMEEDPQAAGLIGYGPHASNPLTGEIVHAKTIMYLGTMKKWLKYDYDNLVKEKLAALNPSSTLALTLSDELKARASAGGAAGGTAANARVAGGSSSHGPITRPVNMKEIASMAHMTQDQREAAKTVRAKMEFMSRNCFFPAETINLEGEFGSGVDKVLEEVGLKPWIELSDVEKQKVIDVLLPYVWKPTLIHELGHNMGLRHNFAGSEDKENFYSKAELAALGMEHAATFSSVMDYGYRTNNELRAMGKYDIAAFKYGYAERVEKKDGTEISLAQLHATPGAELKEYAYCTDEHVSANPNCNRFDEGTNLLEIAQHYVKAYNERYSKSNLRNGRRKFSLFSDGGQIMAVDSMMYEMRLAFERYETIKNTFDVADNDPVWDSMEFLKELKGAMLVAGNFFVDVIKTPDVHCAVSMAANPSQIVALVPIRELSKRAISCFDKENVQLNPQFLIVAEGGKSYQSRKDLKNPNPYVDQIDVRGIWMDKVLATHYLLGRTLGSSLNDQYTENFLHVPEMQAPILSMIEQVLTDEMVGPMTLHTEAGATAEFEVAYKLFSANDANNSHKLPSILDDGARAMFGLPNANTTFHSVFVNQMIGELPDDAHMGLSNAVLNLFAVHKQLPNDGRPREYTPVDIGPGQRVFIHKSSGLALTLAENMSEVQILGALTQEQIEKVLKAIDANSDDGLTTEEKAAKKLGKAAIEKLQQGGFQDPSYYALLLKTLAR